MERIASELHVAHELQAEQGSKIFSRQLPGPTAHITGLLSYRVSVCVPSNLKPLPSPPLTSGRLLSINNFVVAISGRGGGGGAGPSTQIIRADS